MNLPLLLFVVAGAIPEREVVLWHAYRGGEETALMNALSAFMDLHPTVRVRSVALPYETLATKLGAAIPRGNGPDLFIFAHERVGSWVEAGLLLPLDESLTATVVADLHPSTAKAFQYADHTYGLPLAFKTLFLVYNKQLIPTAPQTLDELRAVGQELKKHGVFGFGYPTDDFYFHAAWFFGLGGKLGDPNESLTLLHPEMIASMQIVQRLLLEDGIMPKGASSAIVFDLFRRGKLAVWMTGPWSLGEIPSAMDVGYAPLFRLDDAGHQLSPFLTVEGVLFPTNSKEPEWAMRLGAFLVGKQGAMIRAKAGRQSVAHAGVYADPHQTLDPALGVLWAQLPSAHLMSNAPAMQSVWEPARFALRSIARGSNPVRAIERAERRMKRSQRTPPASVDPKPYLAIAVALGFGVWVALFRRTRHTSRAAPLPITQRMRTSGYLLPAMIAIVVLVVMPFLVGLALAFTHYQGQQTPRFVGFANFLSILSPGDIPIHDPMSFYFMFVVTLLWTVANVALHVALGLGLALVLRQPSLRFRGILRALLILPWAVPNYITALVFKGLFHEQFGALNGLLAMVGAPQVAWFSHFWTAFFANVITNTWLGFPFMMVVILGALESIPEHLYQAADIDGATRWQKFKMITWPLVQPTLFPAIALGMIWTFNMFNVVYLVSGGEPDGATNILISEAYRWAFERGEQVGYACAYATLIFVILLCAHWLKDRGPSSRRSIA